MTKETYDENCGVPDTAPPADDAARVREIGQLRDGLDAIRQYGSDTLRGPSKASDDNRDWQRAAVLEMTNRAVRVLNGDCWKGDANG